ncbi:MAG TPA: S1C family serine protease [Pirellulales bacterium]
MSFLFFTIAASEAAPKVEKTAKPQSVIAEAQQKMVKVYGAGGLRGLEAYQSGFLISSEGHVLTVFSYVLDSDVVNVTLNDGRKFEAKLLGADPRLEIAVLKIEAADLPYFDLKQAATGAEGTRVLTFSNLFGVATGDEPVSMLHGTIAAVTSLAARRGAYETPYQGQVYVLDAMTNNPGAAGGALTNLRGQLLGLLGKELRNSRNNTWLNYAIPANELVEAVEAIKSGQSRPVTRGAGAQAKNPVSAEDLGLVLVPNVLDRTPPFIDAVRANSPAAKAGIHADDLVVFINNQLVQSCNALQAELTHLDRESDVHLVMLRGGELMEVTLKSASE